jgi:hypothetical protein
MDDDDQPDDDPDVVAGMERLRAPREAENDPNELLSPANERAGPRCPECTTKLELGGTDEHPYWVCPRCHVARLS